MSDNAATWAILGGVFAALLLGGIGLYYMGAGPVLRDWWERFKQNQAARASRAAEDRAIRQAQEVVRGRELPSGIEVGLVPTKALDGAVEIMTRSGYALNSRTENTATFARDQGADACLGCFLMLLFIIPGLLYLLLANKTVRVTVAAYPRDEGGSRLVIGGDDQQGARNLKQWARSLPTEPMAEALPAPEEPTDPTPPNRPTLAARLRDLTEARDAGLISEDEYQAKRAELLGRM